MSLERYNEKRDFAVTSEPRGEVGLGGGLHYVLHHHFSRHEHFDLRLEWRGVLLSWAVPKGVSSEIGVKRLAVHVEDHPLEYRNFAGSIPEGQYGAGVVKIADLGHWKPLNDVDEAIGSSKGVLKFEILGEKFKGEWVLIKTARNEKDWLLIRER